MKPRHSTQIYFSLSLVLVMSVLSACVHVSHLCLGVLKGQKRVLKPLELMLVS